MQQDVLVVADRGGWLKYWSGPVVDFTGLTPDLLEKYRVVVLAPEDVAFARACNEIFDWKRGGRLATTRLMLGTYKGRHIWTPENDAVVDRWVVHASSERQVLDSDKLVFVPLCRGAPKQVPTTYGDYVFMGGRKWRELDVGMAAIVAAGLPGRIISDFAPEGDFPDIEVTRAKLPKDEYLAAMGNARVVGIPLRATPVSHGHTEVVNAVILGRPVVMTGGASCDDYVEHGVNALLLPDNDVATWAAALREAWTRADEFAAGSREIAPQFHAPRYAGYIRAIVDELL